MARSTVFADVLARIEAGETLSSREIRSLYDGVCRLIRCDASAEEEDEADLLFRRLEALYANDPDIRGREDAFDIGVALASIEVYEHHVRLQREDEANEPRRALIERYFSVFALIAEQPYIAQADMASNLGETASSISQKLRIIRGEGSLVTMLRQGQRKRYRLTPLGRRLYDEVKRDRDVSVKLTKELMSMKPKGREKAAVPVRKGPGETRSLISRTNCDAAMGRSFRIGGGVSEEREWSREQPCQRRPQSNSYSGSWSQPISRG